MSAIKEELFPKGKLYLCIEREGKEEFKAIDNLIVTGGRNALASLLGGSGSGKNVTTVAVGEGGDVPIASDTGLTNSASVQISSVKIGTNLEAEDGRTFSDPRTVQFHFLIGKSVGNGLSIREYGLFCSDGTLFSRIVRDAAFIKTDIDSIRGFWQIQF